MALKTILIITMFFASTVAQAQIQLGASDFQVRNDIAKLYQEKKYSLVIQKYLANRKRVLHHYQTALLVNISYEKLRQYPEALALNFEYLRENYEKDSTRLRTDLQNNQAPKSSEYSNEFKALFFRIYGDYSQKILGAGWQGGVFSKDQFAFEQYKKALDALEYQGDAVQKIHDKVEEHLKLLEKKQYRWRTRVFIDYLSWQTSATLIGPFETTALLATNVGICPGVGVSYESSFWALSLDLSYLSGSGGVSVTQGAVNYRQESVPASGFKAAFGAGMIVSESRSELGLRATFLYVNQSLATPATAGYSIDQPNTFSQVISLYSRWTFDQFYLQSDFGRYVKRPATLWSIGVGYSL
jgi:hypothetical protein